MCVVLSLSGGGAEEFTWLFLDNQSMSILCFHGYKHQKRNLKVYKFSSFTLYKHIIHLSKHLQHSCLYQTKCENVYYSKHNTLHSTDSNQWQLKVWTIQPIKIHIYFSQPDLAFHTPFLQTDQSNHSSHKSHARTFLYWNYWISFK